MIISETGALSAYSLLSMGLASTFIFLLARSVLGPLRALISAFASSGNRIGNEMAMGNGIANGSGGADGVDRRTALLQRRKARRFNVGWNVRIKGKDSSGLNFTEDTMLGNLSSRGAFFYMTRRLMMGARMEIWIRLPFSNNKWMKYSAEVIRVEDASPMVGIAVRFTTLRPTFTTE